MVFLALSSQFFGWKTSVRFESPARFQCCWPFFDSQWHRDIEGGRRGLVPLPSPFFICSQERAKESWVFLRLSLEFSSATSAFFIGFLSQQCRLCLGLFYWPKMKGENYGRWRWKCNISKLRGVAKTKILRRLEDKFGKSR